MDDIEDSIFSLKDLLMSTLQRLSEQLDLLKTHVNTYHSDSHPSREHSYLPFMDNAIVGRIHVTLQNGKKVKVLPQNSSISNQISSVPSNSELLTESL